MDTALFLHGLSDALPSTMHMTVPSEWSKRRLRVPDGVVLTFGDVPKKARTWNGAVPVTSPLRTLEDCLSAHVRPDLVLQAIKQARERGLITTNDAARLHRALGRAS